MKFIDEIEQPTEDQIEELIDVQEKILEIALSCSDEKVFNTAMMSVFTISMHESLDKCDREEFLRELCLDVWKSFHLLDKENDKSVCF